MNLNFDDFQKQEVKFDINELKKAYNEISTHYSSKESHSKN